jgi:mannitol-specific phosphotransferase system IIBC component
MSDEKKGMSFGMILGLVGAFFAALVIAGAFLAGNKKNKTQRATEERRSVDYSQAPLDVSKEVGARNVHIQSLEKEIEDIKNSSADREKTQSEKIAELEKINGIQKEQMALLQQQVQIATSPQQQEQRAIEAAKKKPVSMTITVQRPDFSVKRYDDSIDKKDIVHYPNGAIAVVNDMAFYNDAKQSPKPEKSKSLKAR